MSPRAFPLQPMNEAGLLGIVSFVKQLDAAGGGDRPEPVDQALAEAVGMGWREAAQGKIIVIGDAPVHQRNRAKVMALAKAFREVPVEALPRSVSAIFTGRDPQARRFLQELAGAGGGDFADHRGQMIESVLLSVLN